MHVSVASHLAVGNKKAKLFRTSGPKKERREPNRPRLSSFNYLTYFSHPEQEAQQSAEAQHDVVAAFTAPARPSATTAINTIARMFFMDFSPLKNQVGFCRPMAMPSV
jgi:hypothetical protein